ARRAVGRGLVMLVAEAAIAAGEEADALAGLGHVVEHRLAGLVEDLGADRHLDHAILALVAGAARAHAVMAVLGPEMLRVAEIDQGVEVGHRLDPDIAAAPAIAAVGAAELDEFLAPERDAARPAMAAGHVDLGLIEKLHGA